MINNSFRRLILIILFIGVTTPVMSQKLVASIDSTSIFIGEEINYKLEVYSDSLPEIKFPESESFTPMEVLKIYDVEEVIPSILLVPMVAFDGLGNRLGNGGGYYDRLFGSLPERSDLVIAGLGFDYQIISDNFKEDHDLKYDLVITEKQK